MSSPEMFDSSFFSLDNNMPNQATFDASQHAPTGSQLQIPPQSFLSFGQQPYSHSYTQQPSRPAGSYPASPSWQLQSRPHQHVMTQYGNHYPYGIRHHPFTLAHALQAKTTADTKARLDKKHVEILEHEFSKNQKPSSIVKRELAEQMGHDIARINNWFQNRRAKEKSIKRTAEYAAREQAVNRQRESSEDASSASQSPEQEQQDENSAEERSVLDNIRRPFLSSAVIGEAVEEKKGEAEQQNNLLDDEDQTPGASLCVRHENMRPNQESGNEGFVAVEDVPLCLPNSGDIQEQLPSPDITLSRDFDYQAPEIFQPLPQTACSNLDYMDAADMDTAWFQTLPQAPSDYFGPGVGQLSLLNAGPPMAMAQAQEFRSDDAPKVEQLASPVSMSPTPPPARDVSSRLKSPRPVNIAARRNHQRPAPLGLGVSRKGSFCQGPKTGIEMPRRRADDGASMRRTASASGLRRLPKVSEAGGRSPGTNFQGMRSPSYNSAASPMSPSRADTPSTSSSEEHHGLPYSNFAAALTARFGEPAVSTPPVTPGLPLGYQSFANPFEQAWTHAANDQPLATPSLCSHGGSEMDFPATSHIPSYIASQPATPGFPRPDAFGPGFRFTHGGMSNAPEYMFPESSYIESSLASSPHEQPASKHFQFAQNVTPQDFSNELRTEK